MHVYMNKLELRTFKKETFSSIDTEKPNTVLLSNNITFTYRLHLPTPSTG